MSRKRRGRKNYSRKNYKKKRRSFKPIVKYGSSRGGVRL